MIKKVVSLFADNCGVITGTRSDIALRGAGYPGRLIDIAPVGVGGRPLPLNATTATLVLVRLTTAREAIESQPTL